MSNEVNIESIKNAARDVTLTVKVIANAKKNAIEFLDDGTVKLRISKAAVDGKANKEIIDFLSETFKRTKNQIIILRGEKSSHKVILIKPSK